MPHLERSRYLPLSWCIAVAGLLLGCQVFFGRTEVSDLDTTSGTCEVGSHTCRAEYLMSCAAEAGWSIEAVCESPERCDDLAGRCATCEEGTLRCEGNLRRECQTGGSGWATIEACPSEEQCSGLDCEPCTPGTFDCAGDPQLTLRFCGEDRKWVKVDSCATEALCSATLELAETSTASFVPQCAEAGCNEPGKLGCSEDGLRLQRCPLNRLGWQDVATCATPQVCAAIVQDPEYQDPASAAALDSCQAPCAPAGALMCDGTKLRRCSDAQTRWEDSLECSEGTACDSVLGVCGELCETDALRCNFATLERCDSAHTWQRLADCGTAALCQRSDGACRPPACNTTDDSAFICEGAQLKRCREDRTDYDDAELCETAALCDRVGKRCRTPACPTNDYRCVGLELQQCNADRTAWKTTTTCAQGQVCNDQSPSSPCQLDCPKEPRCSGSRLEDCTPSGWVLRVTCKSPELCECPRKDPDGQGPLTNSCTAGIFTDGCGTVVCGNARGDYSCDGKKLLKCQAGRNGWDEFKDCGSANLCVVAGNYDGYCAGCPTALEQACMGQDLYECPADRRAWTKLEACALGCVAVSNGQDRCAECNAGDAACTGATLRTCGADRRFTNKTCNSDALCDAAHKQCDLCLATTCAGKVLQRCSADGQTPTSETCVAAALCDADNSACIDAPCAVGERDCLSAQPRVCKADRSDWENSGTACFSADFCVNGACTTPPCAVGQRRCVDGQPQKCKADRTGFVVDGEPCATPALCVEDTGQCTPPECLPDALDCEELQPVKCNAGRTDYEANGPPCATSCTNGLCD